MAHQKIQWKKTMGNTIRLLGYWFAASSLIFILCNLCGLFMPQIGATGTTMLVVVFAISVTLIFIGKHIAKSSKNLEK